MDNRKARFWRDVTRDDVGDPPDPRPRSHLANESFSPSSLVFNSPSVRYQTIARVFPAPWVVLLISVRFVVLRDNRTVRTRIKSQGAFMMQARFKRRPTRNDLAAAWKIIRDQSQIIKLQAGRINWQKVLLASLMTIYPKLEELKIK
jgi:hypothetical protein